MTVSESKNQNYFPKSSNVTTCYKVFKDIKRESIIFEISM